MTIYDDFDPDATQPMPAIDAGLSASFDAAVTSDEAAMLLNITPSLFRLLAVKADLPYLLTDAATWYRASDVLALHLHPVAGLVLARHASE